MRTTQLTSWPKATFSLLRCLTSGQPAPPPGLGSHRPSSSAVPTRIQWSAAMLTAFKVAKNSLTTTTDLPHPSPQAKLALVADASATHVGAALHQQRRPGGPCEPLGFFSKKMDSTQATVLLTGSFLLPSAPSGTSGSKWKATISSFGQPPPPHLCSGLLL